MTTKVDDRITELRGKLNELQGQLERPVIEEAIAAKTGDTEAAHRASEEVRQISASMAEIGGQIRAIELEEKERAEWRRILPKAVAANERMRAATARIRDVVFLLAEAAEEFQEAAGQINGPRPTVERLSAKFQPSFRFEDAELEHVSFGDDDSRLPDVLSAIAGGHDTNGFKNRPMTNWTRVRSHMRWHKNGKGPQ